MLQNYFFKPFSPLYFFFKFPNTCVVFFFSPSVLQLPAGEEVTKVTRQVRNWWIYVDTPFRKKKDLIDQMPAIYYKSEGQKSKGFPQNAH